MKNKQYQLHLIIAKYLILKHKINLILLFLIIISAFGIVLITNETRLSIKIRENYSILQKEENYKWRHLIFNKYELISHYLNNKIK